MNLGDNPNLSKNVEKDTLLKKWLVYITIIGP